MGSLESWWTEVIWYWVFAIGFIILLSKMHRVTLLTLMIFIGVIAAVVVLTIFAGAQPRING